MHKFPSLRRRVRTTPAVLLALVLVDVLNATIALAQPKDIQVVMKSTVETASSQGWKVTVSDEWDVLGPFPIHAREQHFLSPSFPLNLSEPIDLHATYASSYADGGFVGWSKAQSQEDGTLQVSFPHIRWDVLRATEGWAAMQHHNLLRTTFTVHPPSEVLGRDRTAVPRLLVRLAQGSFFTVLPGTDRLIWGSPEWHAGNIYDMGNSPANTVDFPSPPSLTSPTCYTLVVSGDYEIRLFGDPRHTASGVPTLAINLTLDLEHTAEAFIPVVHDATHDVVCDFVDGWAFGDAIGVGLRSLNDWWTVLQVTTSGSVVESVELSLVRDTRIAPTQTRILPIKITQKAPIYVNELELTLKLQSGDVVSEIFVNMPLKHHAPWSSQILSTGIKASYFFGTSMPTLFVVSPPAEPHDGLPPPPILALHGAGVDVIGQDFWIRALPRQQRSWVIAPTGRTAWGLDWHGPSARDAFGTVDALYHILATRDEWRPWGLERDTRVLLMGHSNGGQGAWYLAGRYPDRVVGVVPAAGYIKSQSYVSWVQSRSAHFVDPGLRAILDSSFTPDDNDLFLSNLVDTPILAIHGGDDDNVPVWHTREAVSVLKTWNPRADVTFREDPGQPHWYDEVFSNEQVESFVSKALQRPSTATPLSTSRDFTLTVATPADSGSLHGWSIHALAVPGRLARLRVQLGTNTVKVHTKNVRAFSIRLGALPEDVRNAEFLVDDQSIELDEATWELPDYSLALVKDVFVWIPHSLSSVTVAPPTGRIANFLTTNAPFVIAIPKGSSPRLLSAALRIAHNLDVYHRLDAEIVDHEEVAWRIRVGSLGRGNIVVLDCGIPSAFTTSVLGQGKTFGVRRGNLMLRGHQLNEPSSATLFLHPHPTFADSLALFLYGSDADGLERALRLFPIRTGVTVPDWIVVGADADKQGSGGVKGAGVWGNDWSWNEAMSAF